MGAQEGAAALRHVCAGKCRESRCQRTGNKLVGAAALLAAAGGNQLTASNRKTLKGAKDAKDAKDAKSEFGALPYFCEWVVWLQ